MCTCSNRLTIARQEVEERALRALQHQLMDRECFEEFCREYTREINRLRMEQRAHLTGAQRELARLEARRKKFVQSIIMDGVPGAEVKDELIAIGARREELNRQLEVAQQPPPLLHPQMADVYHEQVNQLARALQDESSRSEASEAIRQLVEAIVLEPDEADGEKLKITLKGDLAGMLAAAQKSKRSPETGDLLASIQLVAGRATISTCSSIPRRCPARGVWIGREESSPSSRVAASLRGSL